jgi:predicted DNA binding CopG/RHH family protein
MKKLPSHSSDADAEEFVETADLSKFDLSGFVPARFEFNKKDARVNFRVPTLLLDAVKASAAERGIPYQRYIRDVLEQAVDRSKRALVSEGKKST